MKEEEDESIIIGPRIGLSLCYFISGVLFFSLLLDSHYKMVKSDVINNAFGTKV